MDPVTGFSLAVNVLTAVDIAVKTGKTLRELYKSTSGFTKQTQELIQAVDHFEEALVTLETAKQELSTPQSLGADDATAEAAKRCSSTMQAIRCMLDECRVVKPSSVRGAIKGWYQTKVKHGSRLKELQATLESSTSQLSTSLAISTRTDVARMKQLLDGSDEKQAQLATKMDTVSAELAKFDDSRKLLEMVKEALILSNDSLNAMNHNAILRALRPATAGKRAEEIRDPVANTFAWILEKPSMEYSSAIVTWLKAGSGVFHFAGKPGCGKSTLMKFLASHDKTREYLHEWADTAGKQLILSSFFFWRLGSDEQRTMRGLMRGLLYDVIRGNSEIARVVLPEHWTTVRYGSQLTAQTPEPSLSGSQIEVAFDRLLKCEEILRRFKICLFIDGLDEFDEPTESLWGFSSKLQGWTERNNVKLCISSREEAPILQAFHSAERITLHTISTADIEALVCNKLESNPNFRLLEQSDLTAVASSKLQRSIIKHAEGVFLWVVLLLKWMEDELATGAATFAGLRRLVDTAPQELDGFFTSILESIPKHHSRGAYFVLFMMLRLRGYSINHEWSQVPKATEGYRELSVFGLSYIFDAFDSVNPGDGNRRVAFLVQQCAHTSEYRDRRTQAASRLQSWCKGLIEARKRDGVRVAVFTHRSVFDFLSSKLRDIAPRWNMDDDWIAEGILATCLAETKARYGSAGPHEEKISIRLEVMVDIITRTTSILPALPTSRIFTLLDEIDAARRGLKRGAPEDIGSLCLGARFIDCGIIAGASTPVFAIMTGTAVPLVGYVMWKLEDSQILKDPLGQLLMLAAIAFGTFERHANRMYPDVSPIVRAVLASGISPSIRYPQFRSSEYHEEGDLQICCFSEWLDYLASGRSDPVITNKSPWRDVLSLFLELIAFSDKGAVPDSIWNELQVWLQFGAEVPSEVLVITLPGLGYSRAAVGFRYPTEKAEVACRSERSDSSNIQKAGDMEYFRTFKSTTLSSMIRWHSPQNMEALLLHSDPVSSMAEDTQQWMPPPYKTHTMLKGGHRQLPDYDPRRYLKGEPAWTFGLSWRADLHEWDTDDDD